MTRNSLSIYKTTIENLSYISQRAKSLFENGSKYGYDVEEELSRLVDSDPRVPHVFVQSVLSSTLKNTSFSLYDFYKDEEGKIEKKVDAAKASIDAFVPVFEEAQSEYPSIASATSSPENTKVFMQAHRWVHGAAIKKVDVKDVVVCPKDSPFSAYEYFFSFKNRMDAVTFAKNNPTNFIAFALFDPRDDNSAGAETHLYFIAKYGDGVYIIRNGSETDEYGLIQFGRATEPDNPFTAHGDPYVASGLFKDATVANNLPMVKTFTDEELKTVSYGNMSDAQKLFISYAQERLVEDIKAICDNNKIEVVSNMQQANLLPYYGEMVHRKTEPLCQSTLGLYWYDRFESEISNIVPAQYDFFATEREFALMMQYQKEAAIRQLILEKAEVVFGDKVISDHYLSSFILKQEHINELIPHMIAKSSDLEGLAKVSDRVEVYVKGKKQFNIHFVAVKNGEYGNDGVTQGRIGLFDRIILKKGSLRHNDYNKSAGNNPEWRQVGSEDAEAVLAVSFYSTMTLAKMLGDDVFNSLPFVYQMMERYTNGSTTPGVTKSHFNLNSPLDMLANRCANRHMGLTFYFPIAKESIGDIIEAVQTSSNESSIISHIEDEVIKSGIPTFMVENEKMFLPRWDTTSTGKIPGCALYRKAQR